MGKSKLIKQILTFEIDEPGAEYTFTDRLAKENQWSDAYARRVVREYKRFVVLAMVGERQVTPSLAVDEAWHLHLTYTVSYWEKMHAFLPRKLHHHPTTGGKTETARFADQYLATLRFYGEVFGEDAPADIWPDPTRPVAIPTPRRKPSRSLLAIGAVMGLTLLVAGCRATDSLAVLGPVQIGATLGIAGLIGLVVYFVNNRNRGWTGCSTGPPGCSGGPVMGPFDSGGSGGGHHGGDGAHGGHGGHGGGHGDHGGGHDGGGHDGGSDSGGGDSGGGDGGGGCGGGGCSS